MDRNRLTGFGFVLLGFLQLSSLLTTGSVEDIEVFNLLMAVGGLSLAGIGAWIVYQGNESEVRFESSRQTGAVAALAAAAVFIGAFAYAFVG
jgi:hypothetical protein